MSTIIVLNGPGSAGKSSTARALQAIAAQTFMHVSMDAFLEMLPDRLFGTPEGLIFEKTQQDGAPAIVIHSGPAIQLALRGMRRSVVILAAEGADLIVDEVMLGGEAADYQALLVGHDLRFVGLFAPLDLLEARERARGDREIGLSRWQHERVHLGVPYDLEIDTAHTTPEQNARLIAEAFGL